MSKRTQKGADNSKAEAGNKKKNIKVELKKLLKDNNVPNCQLKLTSLSLTTLCGSYLRSCTTHEVSIVDVNKVKIEDIPKLNALKDEIEGFCEFVGEEQLTIDSYFKDSKRIYQVGDILTPFELIDLEKGNQTKLSLSSDQDNLLIFTYLSCFEEEKENLNNVIKFLALNNKANTRISLILCPEIDQVLQDDHDDCEEEEENDEEEAGEEKEKHSHPDLNFQELLSGSIKSILEYVKSEEFNKLSNNQSVTVYYMENLKESVQEINDALNLFNVKYQDFIYYFVSKEGKVTNISQNLNELFTPVEKKEKQPKNWASLPSLSEKEINSLEKKFEEMKFEQFEKANYEFVYYRIYFKTVHLISSKSIDKLCENYPCIRFFLPKSHHILHQEVVKLLDDKKVLEKFDIKGEILDYKQEVTQFLRFFQKECEKEGIIVTPDDLNVVFVKKIKTDALNKKINFNVVLKEENNNKEYFLKMGRIKETVGKLYDEKRSKFQIFYKINVIQSFKAGQKFVKIPALIDLKTNQEVNLAYPQGKVFLVNFFNVIFGDKHCNIKAQEELLIKNKEKWGNNVEIIAISNYPRVKLEAYINEHKISNIQFYLEQKKLPCFDYLYENKEKFPEIAIMNKFGTIVYTGDIDEYVQLEHFIDTLVSSNEDLIVNSDKFFITNPPKKPVNISLAGGNIKGLGKSFDKFYLENISEAVDYDFKLKFVVQKKYLYDKDFNIIGKELKRIHMDGYLFEKEKQLIDKYLASEVYPFLGEDIFKPNIVTMKEEIVNLRKNCEKCKVRLDKKNYYACYWCKISLCEACGEHRDMSKLGVERYSHPHNLIFINSKIVSNAIKVETHKIGNNVIEKTTDIDTDLTEKFSDCNGCRKYIKKGYRFTCLHCVPGYREEGYNDICEKCFGILKNPSHKKYKQVLQNLKEFEHDHNNHVLFRIAYAKTYFEF